MSALALLSQLPQTQSPLVSLRGQVTISHHQRDLFKWKITAIRQRRRRNIENRQRLGS